MENQKGIFRNWSWKKFILEFLFFFAIQFIVGYFLSFIDFFKPEFGLIREMKSMLFQTTLMTLLFTIWDDSKREPILIILYKKLFQK